MFKLKNTIKNNSTTSKNFSYQKGEVKLDFNLRTDTKNQLKDFKDLLEVALQEVNEEIKK